MVAAPQRDTCITAATTLACVRTAPLGRPVVPPGELDQGRVFGPDVDPGQAGGRTVFDEPGKMQPAFLELQFLGRAHPEAVDIVGHPGDDDPGDLDLAQRFPDLGQDQVEGDQRGHPGLSHQSREFPGRVHGVEVDHDGSQEQSGVIGDDVLGTGGQVNPHPLALGHPQFAQGVGQAQHLEPQFPESRFRSVKIEGRLVGVSVGRQAQICGAVVLGYRMLKGTL